MKVCSSYETTHFRDAAMKHYWLGKTKSNRSTQNVFKKLLYRIKVTGYPATVKQIFYYIIEADLDGVV